MRALKVAIPSLILAAGFLVCTTASYGTPVFAKKTGKTCTFCHAKITSKEEMPKNLTAAGKYYQEHHTLDGYTGK